MEGYPICCIAHFCWDSLVGSASAAARADQLRLGLDEEWPFVPCGVIHKKDSPLSLRTRLRRIVAHQWFTLRPGSRGRAFRRLTGKGISTARAPWTAPLQAEWYREQVCQRDWFYDGGLDPELDWK